MVTIPWSENFPLQGIKFPHGGSSGVENGLNNLCWETWVYELGPLRGQVHSFHSSGWGWNIEPPAWDRRSLLTESSRGGPSRRDIISGNHTLPGHRGQWKVVEPGPGELSPGLPGAERSGEMHTDEASVDSGQWDISRDANRSTCAWPNSLYISSTTSGWSLYSPGLGTELSGEARQRADWQEDAHSVLIFLISSGIKPPPGMKETPRNRQMDSEHRNDRWENYDWGWEEYHINSGSSILLMPQLFSR